MNWVDFIIVLLVFLMAIYGYNRGMFRMLFSVISFILVIAVSVFVAPVIADKIAENERNVGAISGYISKSLGMDEKMFEMLGETQAEMTEEENIKKDLEHIKAEKGKNKQKKEKTAETDTAVSEEKPLYIDASLLTECGFPQFLAEKVFEMSGVEHTITQLKGASIRLVNKKLCDTIAKVIIKIIVFLVIVVIMSLVLSVLARVLGILGRFPGISTLNHIGGTIVGIIEGVIVIWLLGLLVIIFCQMGNGVKLLKDIQESGFGRYLMYHNIIVENFL